MVFIIGLLKVIGFILLFFVLLILFLFGIILFLPISYECDGNGPPYKGNAKIKWLFGLIRIKFDFSENGMDYRIHVFHKSWPEIKKTKEKKPKHSKTKQSKSKQNKSEQKKSNQNQKIQEETKDSNLKEDTLIQDKFRKKHTTFLKNKKEEKHKSILQKIKEIWKQIKDEENKALLKFGLKQLFFLLKKIKPNKIKANIVFSTTDPATTGEILGALALIKWTYKNGVHIIPDFTSERYRLEGTLFIKGNIYGLYFFIVAIRFLKNKKIREMLFHRR